MEAAEGEWLMASAAMESSVPARMTRPLFVATVFAGSFLLFLTQPLVARMALPRLGGAPAVWNSAMLVYQALLLGGYAYAHAIGRLAPARQAAIQLGMLMLAALWLPLGLVQMAAPVDADPIFWVPWLLLLSVGPLFLAVAAQAPLMQRWFTHAAPGCDPYPLYAASNLGSFAGLLSYPLLLEPAMPLHQQSLAWSTGYLLLFTLVIACAIAATRRPQGTTEMPKTTGPEELVATQRWLRWAVLAAVPSGLMLSTTTHLTTDIVAMPLIWVIPLGLYLLSFTVAFAERQGLARAIAWCFPFAIILGGWLVFGSGPPPFLSAGIGLAVLFVTAVTLHRTMYLSRPGPRQLTSFYLAMSVGGVVGGAFCALLAPLIFDWVYEHPLLLLAAALLISAPPLLPAIGRLWGEGARAARIRRWIMVGTFMTGLYAGQLLMLPVPDWAKALAGSAIWLAALFSAGRPVVFTACVAALMLANGGTYLLGVSLTTDSRERSYFGVYTVQDRGVQRELVHGTTLHGIQLRGSPAREVLKTSYYAPNSGVGLAMQAAPRLFGREARIGVVGLGAGTLACYARIQQSWRFYEIDPVVAAIARNPERFTFLSRCLPDPAILIGDARLTLAAERGPPLDLLVIDAFSSDAIPAHLLTLEAFDVYRRRLSPRGLLLVHISNRFIDLEPVVAAAAKAGGWSADLRDYFPTDAEKAEGAGRSVWVALSHDPKTLEALTRREGTGLENWASLGPRPGFKPWTDDHSSILPVLRALE
jgi:spermidine synthase